MEFNSAILAGREHIAKLAKADGEHTFAREVLAGCWDHRDDVKNAIARASNANQKTLTNIV